ncbi:hypothetical protein [Tenacibaculum sp. UWU-22]|uniref:hypothetical protein n=1 Tax=Tenacibaculum sp. UWU-22 TaxID=3234187 RepID=UPI0034DB42FF
MKKIYLLSFCLFLSQITSAQCAMCKAVIENGNKSMAQGVNHGITYLMIFPYILVALLAYFLWRYKEKIKN